MLRKIYYTLPPKARFIARKLYYTPIDFWESITGKRTGMVPPKGMIYTGSGDFVRQGERIKKNLIELTDLKPEHHVLDIGSGIGRLAVALTSYLNEKGSYEGFDVVKTGVDWCQQKITPKHPQFNFKYVDLNNDLYKSSGDSATEFVFPYDDDRFDQVALISVFTHMLPEEVAHYLKEIKRVLKPGAKCFATFFVLTEESEPEMKDGAFQFKHQYEHYALMDEKVKAANVAFKLDYLEKISMEAELEIQKLYPGYWFKGQNQMNARDFQDIVIFKN